MSIDAAFRLDYGSFCLELSLQLPSHGVSVLFGPSGCGKTSILRAIAGLERLARGRLSVNGHCWQDDAQHLFLPPHQRALGMVFQEASLFPHLTVARNLAYGWRPVQAGERRVAWQQALDLLGIGQLLDRLPARLSGGERQRVAIARALLTSPQLLLMDEPLSALDYQRKQDILPYLERLQRELEIPVVYVSHAIDEVVRLADYLVLLDQGRVVAAGTPTEALARLDLPAAFRDEASVVLAAKVSRIDTAYQLAELAFDGGSLWLAAGDLMPGGEHRVRIHARDVSIALDNHADSSILNRVPARIESAAPCGGSHMLVRCQAQSSPLLARITRRSFDQLALHGGQAVWLQIKAVSLV